MSMWPSLAALTSPISALLDTATHIEAAEEVIRPSCTQAVLDNDWRTFGMEPAPQPSLGIIARFSCS